MDSQSAVAVPVRVRAENIGGIDRADVSLSPGTTVLSGRNATNRTSFLQAIMAAMGSDRVTLKGDSDEGHVELSIGEETYTRRLVRRGDDVELHGDPYLEDPELADLFAFLLESNDARRAVVRGDDLRERIMRPIDTEEITAEIERLEAEKRDLDGRLEELDDLEATLPALEADREDVVEQIEETRAALEAKEEEIDAASAALEASRAGQAELDERLEESKETRSSLETVRFQLETERDSLAALEAEREELSAELESLPDDAGETVAEIESETERLRTRRNEIDARVNEIHTVVQFNREMLEGTSSQVAAVLRDDDGGSPTDQLVEAGESVVCWTCGSAVDRDQIEETIERLRELQRGNVAEREELSRELDELSERRSAISDQRQERERVERQLQRVEEEIEERESAVADLEERREALAEEMEALEDAIDELESDVNEELLAHHREANELEFEIGRLAAERDDVEEEIASIESSIDEREAIEARRDSVRDELERQRTRIERVEWDSIEQFNEHTSAVLDLLEYGNLERIWIERTEREVSGGRGTTTEPRFELHVVRSTDDDVTYEDTVDHLSESEREVTGLVFALAGYLVHDVHEVLPFVLLDSLEAIDAERIAALVEYLESYAEYLVVALLPEDAAPLEGEAAFVTEI